MGVASLLSLFLLPQGTQAGQESDFFLAQGGQTGQGGQTSLTLATWGGAYLRYKVQF